MMKYDRYLKFRQETYQMLGKAKDATFELMDSIMTTRNASCLAEFSLSPLFKRKWSSTYEALQDSRPNRNKLMKRYIQEMPSSKFRQKASSFVVSLGWRTIFRAKGCLVSELGGMQAPATPLTSSICSSFWSRSLVSICQAETSLDFTQFEYSTTIRKME
jgi:hypothetical protein